MFKCEKTNKMIFCLNKICDKKEEILLKYFKPLLLLTLRLLIASVFLKSGLAKFSNMDSAILLFEYEYQVPFLSPVFAAYSATFFELSCAIALIFGVATRVACLPLIAITLVIQFGVMSHEIHLYWLAILSTIFILGAGVVSLDFLIKKYVKKCGDTYQNKFHQIISKIIEKLPRKFKK